MITIEQVQKLRDLHDTEKAAYMETFNNGAQYAYDRWVKACDELNKFIESITQ